jgi:hypothetical protein
MAIDWAAFYKNRSEFPLEELEKYAGRWIAWAPDGASIVASSVVSDSDLIAQVEAAGRDPGECCVSYIPHEDDLFDGAVILRRALDPARQDSRTGQTTPTCSGPGTLDRQERGESGGGL